MAKIGYARISASDQNMARQLEQLADVDKLYQEAMSGASKERPQLKAMLSMRNLLRDLKANLLDNQAFRKELEKILLDPALSAELRAELSALAPKQP